jgi:hypothetical protein
MVVKNRGRMSRYRKPAKDFRKGDLMTTPFAMGLIVTSVRRTRKGSIRVCARAMGDIDRRGRLVCNEYAPGERLIYEI